MAYYKAKARPFLLPNDTRGPGRRPAGQHVLVLRLTGELSSRLPPDGADWIMPAPAQWFEAARAVNACAPEASVIIEFHPAGKKAQTEQLM